MLTQSETKLWIHCFREQCISIVKAVWDPECCLHLPSCKQDDWTSHSDWFCRTAISLTCSGCERPALPEHKCFFYILCSASGKQPLMRLFTCTTNLANHFKQESVLCLFAETELSLGGMQCVCVLVFRSSPVSQGGCGKADVWNHLLLRSTTSPTRRPAV